MTQTQTNPNDKEQPLVEHLTELRNRLLRSVLCVFIIFLVLVSFANQIYAAIALPLIERLPEGTSMIATEVASPFLAPFKLTLFVAMFLSAPYLLFQCWGFIAPGLYKNEKQLAIPLLLSSIILFYCGIAFAYFVVFPLLFNFLILTAPVGVQIMTDISQYLNFVLKLFFAFGLAFEVPIATILLIKSGIVSRESLAEKRPYIIVFAFILGMLLTPPDVISQALLALPIWLLFECGLIFSRFIGDSEKQAQ